MLSFSQRAIEPELLDHADPEEARVNLADLIRINRYFGGHSTIRKMLAEVVRDGAGFSVLDVAAASGDTSIEIRRQYPQAAVTSLDYNAVNLGAAPTPKVVGDAFCLPFAKESFDYVLSSLFLHHFTNDQVVDLLRELYGAARRALLIADLERHVLPYLFLPATKHIFGWRRLTLHDGPISVRAAFRAEELQELAVAAGIRDVQVRRHRPAFRLTLVAVK